MVFLSFFFWFAKASCRAHRWFGLCCTCGSGVLRGVVEGVCSRVDLFGGLPKDVFAVGVKPHVPEAHLLHEALRLLQLALTPKECLNKLDA